jgi:hypothetical protein
MSGTVSALIFSVNGAATKGLGKRAKEESKHEGLLWARKNHGNRVNPLCAKRQNLSSVILVVLDRPPC